MARRRRAAPRRTTSTGAPFQPRESVPSAIVRSICARRLDRGGEERRRLADGGRELPQDPLDLLALRARRLRLAVRELDDVERLDEERLAGVGRVVDDPGHAPAGARLHRQHGPAAAEGDELLLQVLAQLARADELLELVAHALPPGAELAAQLAELRRGVVAQVGAVLLDGAVDRLRDGRERRVDRRGELAQERRRPPRRARRGPAASRSRCRRRAAAPAARARRRERRAPPARGRRGSSRAAARATRPGARSPRPSVPAAAPPRPGRATARARRRARRRARSRWRPRPAPGSRETPARRARSGPSDRV